MRDFENRRANWRMLRVGIILMICAAFLVPQTEGASALTTPDKVKIKSVTQTESALKGTTLKVKWYQVSGCSGYQVQYSRDRFFLGKKTRTVKGSSATSLKVKYLDEDITYYVRVRSYKTKDGATVRSGWTTYDNFPKTKTAKKKKMKSGLKGFELRSAAKQKVPGYDSMQGGCYGKGYLYFVLNNRNTGKCRIAKVRLKSMKVVKVSGVLNVHHGNDITYNSKKNRLVVAHSTGATKTVSVVNPSSLKIEYNVKVEVPRNLPGMSERRRGLYNGFGAIAYNKKHNRYVVLLRGSNFHHLMILDKDFQPVKFLPLEVRATQTVQGIDSFGDAILVGQSYSKGKPYNNVLIYDWEGNYRSKLNLGRKYELETIFHTKEYFYAGYYTAYYKYKPLKKKNVLYRDGYVFRITNL